MTGFYLKHFAKRVKIRYLVPYQLLQNVSLHAWMCVWVGCPPAKDKKNSLELAGFEPATFCTFDDRPIDAKQTRYHCAITSLYHDLNNPGLFI